MIELDNDLQSRQNARELVQRQKGAGDSGRLFAAANRRHREKRGPKQRTTPKRWRKWPRKRLVLATGRTKC